jgi:hypothetical protein
MGGKKAAKAKVGIVLRRQQPAGQVVAETVLGAALLRQQQVFLLRQQLVAQAPFVVAKAGASVSTNRSASSKLPSARLYAILYMPGFIGKRNY